MTHQLVETWTAPNPGARYHSTWEVLSWHRDIAGVTHTPAGAGESLEHDAPPYRDMDGSKSMDILSGPLGHTGEISIHSERGIETNRVRPTARARYRSIANLGSKLGASCSRLAPASAAVCVTLMVSQCQPNTPRGLPWLVPPCPWIWSRLRADKNCRSWCIDFKVLGASGISIIALIAALIYFGIS